MHLVEISIFSPNHVIITRPIKIIKNTIYVLALQRSLVILVGLTMTGFSEKMLISNIFRRGLMPNLIKISWKVSNQYASLLFYSDVRMSKDFSNMNE